MMCDTRTLLDEFTVLVREASPTQWTYGEEEEYLEADAWQRRADALLARANGCSLDDAMEGATVMVPKLRAAGEWVIVRREPPREKEGIIVVPDVAKEINVNRGEVMAVGRGHPHEKTGAIIPWDVSVGDRVWWMPYAGEAVKLGPEGDELLAVLGKWIVAVEDD